jgi:hypothetical protein
VIAPETTSAGVAAMAATTAGVVRQRLLVAGFDPDRFDVALGWAEFPHRATDREGLMTAALEALDASAGRSDATPAAQGGASTEPAAGSV